MSDLPPSYPAPPPVEDLHPPAEEALPSYDQAGVPTPFDPTPGIDDNVPNHYRIADKFAPSYVLPSNLEAHLLLLGAFHRLREEVRTYKGGQDIPMTPDERWAVFLQKAVYRLECWVTRMIGNDEDEEDKRPEGLLRPNEVPPLDVLMVWHTYLLNPRAYFDNCLRKFWGLLNIGSFPLMQVAGTIDKETQLPHPPSENRSSAFLSFTGQPFDPPIGTTSQDTLMVFCPNCSQPIAVPWIAPEARGFAQRGFTATCRNFDCQMAFTRETIAVRRFYEDMEKCIIDPDRNFLANTVVDWSVGGPVPEIAKMLCAMVLSGNPGTPPQPAEVSGWQFGWTYQSLDALMRKGFLRSRNAPYVETPRGINIILSGYREPGPFNMDLASAVIRQMSFIEKMIQLGWTEPGRFEHDTETLGRCVVRYHHFLMVMASTKGKCVVPTLDIDLAWHTHQLLCTSYRKLHEVLGIVPDHDDKVSQDALAGAYDETAAAWKAQFGVPYSLCGCLPPEKAQSTVSTSGVKSLFSRQGKAKAEPEKPLENPRKDLVALSDAAAQETHPSDHNAVAVINPGEHNAASAQMRRGEMAKRAKDLTKAIEKGKADPWGELQHKRMPEHTHSFLCPVEYGSSQPFSAFGNGDCAAMSGGGFGGARVAGECVKGLSGIGNYGLCAVNFEVPRNAIKDTVVYGAMLSNDFRQYQRDMGMAQMEAYWGMMGGYGNYM